MAEQRLIDANALCERLAARALNAASEEQKTASKAWLREHGFSGRV